MRTPRISELLIAAALIGAPSAAALAEPATSAHVTAAKAVAATPSNAPSTRTDADRYAARDAKDTSVKDFRGGSGVIIFGGGALTLLLVVVLVLVLV